MNDFDKILEIANENAVSLSHELRNQLHKEMALGMTRFVCRHGTLSDSFDKLTESQIYYQANKEAYIRANELRRLRANAKKANAELLEAKEDLRKAVTEIEKLKAQARLELAELNLFELLVTAEDTARQLDEFNKIRGELRESVRSAYPEGIEQAELDNWRAVAEYKAFLKQVGCASGPLNSLPLPSDEKAKIGVVSNNPEMAAWYLVQNKAKLKGQDMLTFLKEELKLEEGDK